MKQLGYTLVKRCVVCSRWYGHRKPSGGVLTASRWNDKVTCTNRCHALRRWNAEREIPSDRFWRQVKRAKKVECWPYLGALRDKKGYGGFYLSDGKSMRAHRAAWHFTHGPIGDGLVVCHRCDNKICCNPYHLRLGTVADNNADTAARSSNSRRTRDTGHHAAKLSSQQLSQAVAEYRELSLDSRGRRKQGSVSALAKKHNVSLSTIWKVARNAH